MIRMAPEKGARPGGCTPADADTILQFERNTCLSVDSELSVCFVFASEAEQSEEK